MERSRGIWSQWLLLVLGFILFTEAPIFSKGLENNLISGLYHAEISGYQGKPIPFQFEIKGEGSKRELILINASERLVANQFSFSGDSVFITLPFFDAEFRLRMEGKKLTGYWVRYLPSGNKKYVLQADMNKKKRFIDMPKAQVDVSGTWDMNFVSFHHPNVGEFFQEKSGRVTGSILSVTGDERYLEGQVVGDSLFLSTFDGAHCYLFTCRINNKTHSLDSGRYYALGSPPVSFKGKFNPKAKLEDVYSLTTLKPGLDTLGFNFKDLKGVNFHYPNQQTHNKVIIIQFLGSWCPNCMDETAFLMDFYQKHSNQVSIIGLAYERSNNWDLSRNSVQRLVDRFKIPYPVLITGFKNQNEDVMASLPQLNTYIGFPTMIIIDKKGKINKIHTGFSGPGTGKYYTEFKKEFTELIQELNSEN